MIVSFLCALSSLVIRSLPGLVTASRPLLPLPRKLKRTCRYRRHGTRERERGRAPAERDRTNRSEGREGMANVMACVGEEHDGYGILSWCLLTWLVMELVFLGVILVFLAPRMNKLEPPAKVRPLVLFVVSFGPCPTSHDKSGFNIDVRPTNKRMQQSLGTYVF